MKVLVPHFLRLRSQRLGWNRRRGQTLVEYSLILAVICVVMVAVFAAFDKQLIAIFSAINVVLDTAQGSH